MIDVVIIGAGVAGLTTAIYVARSGRSVLVLESKAYGGQIVNTLKVDNYPGLPGISGAELAEKLHKQAVDLGAEVKFAEALEVVDSGEVKVVKTDEGDFETRAVVIATGTEPRRLSEKQAADAGERAISYCATCDGALYKGKPVVVVGSGNSAKNEMDYLKNIASKVYHIHHDDPIPADAVAVFVAIGRVPATSAFRGLVDIDEDGFIVAGEDCKTSCPGVFVAGDCRTKGVRQLITAAGDGAAVARAVGEFLK